MNSCKSVSHALDVAKGSKPVVSAGGTPSERLCVVTEGAYRVGLRLVESEPGSRLWEVVEVGIRKRKGTITLIPSGIRDLALSRCFAKAREAVLGSQTNQGGSNRLAHPSDPPAAFLEDRRGKTARTSRDFAELALAVCAGGSADMARVWASTFGGSVKTWRNLITEARVYIQVDDDDIKSLTDEGMELVYGPGVWQSLDIEQRVDYAERFLRKEWTSSERLERTRRARRDTGEFGRREAQEKAWAEHTVSQYYPSRTRVDTFTQLREKIATCTTTTALKRLWVDNESTFDADAALLAEWKAKGKSLAKSEKQRSK